MAHWRFSEEYDVVTSLLKSNAGKTAQNDKALLDRLTLLLETEGPNPTYAGALDELRKLCSKEEADNLIRLAGDGLANGKRAGALKNLRHMYLLSKFGGKDTWMLSLPKSYRAWPTDEVDGLGADALKIKLKDVSEYHSNGEMRDLQAGVQKAIAWAQKAAAVLGTCTAQDPQGKAHRVLIERWFADEDHRTDEKIAVLRTRLQAGFVLIASAAGSGRMILTDNPKYRGTENEDDEAFVVNDQYERLNVVYIERGFFNSTNVLKGMKNWARIMVHELSHSQLKTIDVQLPGDAQKRYAWHDSGIRPRKANFSTEHAIVNAENWAFFAADAAGELTETERNTALKPHVA